MLDGCGGSEFCQENYLHESTLLNPLLLLSLDVVSHLTAFAPDEQCGTVEGRKTDES